MKGWYISYTALLYLYLNFYENNNIISIFEYFYDDRMVRSFKIQIQRVVVRNYNQLAYRITGIRASGTRKSFWAWAIFRTSIKNNSGSNLNYYFCRLLSALFTGTFKMELYTFFCMYSHGGSFCFLEYFLKN
jgi:hypothetical protein